ncbi:hypothetical protein BRADI_1g48818v3 [Brachypodium distachyon]|uniref:Uncharacterized protein n=1 Tax=Brachypodium distachyon TaxID=15368 RepID=A0A2K2DQD4_BRADI|nr:hypothetical protein BRADI_1g48818v3 [Brachypodium distachyon]
MEHKIDSRILALTEEVGEIRTQNATKTRLLRWRMNSSRSKENSRDLGKWFMATRNQRLRLHLSR